MSPKSLKTMNYTCTCYSLTAVQIFTKIGCFRLIVNNLSLEGCYMLKLKAPFCS